ncbi:WXG100 family type VII secretion target [Nocardia blacklockiae]|uniref:WXG100 family type VII secretion target n=1 Tax=Nocardia blacklockiae TaxID=480036 RepID=UPI001894EFB5|nr:WXG100 family type VII secretion target [Nocardia blacklockiae]MBF6171347.1 WXG100 family type VII secretion target [Nocardia blacklockiae]
MTHFWADPERLRAVSPQFELLGEHVDTALTKLREGIEAEGKCWGTDTPGTEFEKQYPQGTGPGSVGESLAALAGLAARLKATGDKITGAANTVQTQDEDSAGRYGQV